MCGRYLFYDGKSNEISKIIKKFEELTLDLSDVALDVVNPSNKAITITATKYTILKWGFNKWDKGLIINTRIESLDNQYYQNVKNNRCLIIASGYFEFKENKKYYHYLDKPMYLAGIYNDNQEFTILTKPSSKNISHIHNRCPLVLDKNEASNYLNFKPYNTLETLLQVKELQ